MKKKLIIGALGLASILAFAAQTQTTEDSSTETDSIFWGTKCKTVQTGLNRSTTMCCYYVFWINTGCTEAG